MSGSVNKVILIGNLSADPEIRAFQSGDRIANLRIATSERWKDRATGEARERTEWHSVVLATSALAGVAERYLRKGMKIYIEGQLSTRKWQDREGRDRYSTEVRVTPAGKLVMLGSRDGGGNGGGNGGNSGGSARPGAAQPDYQNDFDDDVPF